MIWIIMIIGAVMYFYTLDKMDDTLNKCAVYCDEKRREEYKTLEFYNKLFFILGFPFIISWVLLLKMVDWYCDSIETCK